MKLLPIGILLSVICISIRAQDTIYTIVHLDEIAAIAPMKQSSQQIESGPHSSSIITTDESPLATSSSLRGIASKSPNIHIPDYGSTISSTIYMRGLGSRIGTPCVGLYVDDVPQISATAFTFDLQDISSMIVLRGPQSTLYGRNAMAGIICISSTSPLLQPRTSISTGFNSIDAEFSADCSIRHKVNDHTGISASFFFREARGENEAFLTTTSCNKWIDPHQRIGGSLRLLAILKERIKLDFAIRYQHTDEGGYPYWLVDKSTNRDFGALAINNMPTYFRALGTVSAKQQFIMSGRKRLTNVAAFQIHNDCMDIDQDFLATDTFNLRQEQRIRTFSDEIVLRDTHKNCSNTTGIAFIRQWLTTGSFVRFNEGGVRWIGDMMAEGMSSTDTPVKVALADNKIDIPGRYKTPSWQLGIFHQSEISLGESGWNITAGIRINIDRRSIDYSTTSRVNFRVTERDSEISDDLPIGYIKSDYHGNHKKRDVSKQLRLGLSKRLGSNILYISYSEGERSGGYNVQMFADIVSTSFKTTKQFSDNEIKEQVHYMPEQCYNYEAGAHLIFLQKRLTADIATYLMDVENQQVARFAEGGLGRQMVNAGRSRAIGCEAQARYTNPSKLFTSYLSYSYTNSTFSRYTSVVDKTEIDYKGNHIPFGPNMTGSVGIDFIFKHIDVGASSTLTGRVYWDEANSYSEPADAELEAHATIKWSNWRLTVNGTNLTDNERAVFSFESMEHRFAQKNRGRSINFKFNYTF
ncbi:MAG: TonB-dependent receptor [Marinilabiliaceae bacterium]|nr:TonB-dependent receptor [Marinilabiliaceae bacterium]